MHGGLRYLEQYAFRLVAESLAERETLLRMAPHLVWPARFIMPHVPSLRPLWMIRAGLFLYDHLGGHHADSRLPAHEWARSADDVLWRRSKCGLHMTPQQRERVACRLGG